MSDGWSMKHTTNKSPCGTKRKRHQRRLSTGHRYILFSVCSAWCLRGACGISWRHRRRDPQPAWRCAEYIMPVAATRSFDIIVGWRIPAPYRDQPPRTAFLAFFSVPFILFAHIFAARPRSCNSDPGASNRPSSLPPPPCYSCCC